SLRRWTIRVSTYVEDRVQVLRQGLRLFGDSIKTPALQWLKKRAKTFDAHWIMVAYLDFLGNPDELRDHVVAWLTCHSFHVQAQFVYRAWLDAGGDIEMID